MLRYNRIILYEAEIYAAGYAIIFIFASVKCLTLLVLLVSMAAAIIPCCEWDSCQEGIIMQSSHGDEDQQGGCSPLSTCAICAVAIVPGRDLQLLKLSCIQTQYGSGPLREIPPAHSYSSWKPPKA